MARLRDGFATTISIAGAGGIEGTVIFEKTVTPPGFDGNGKIDCTGMRNTAFRTFFAKHLITMTDMVLTVAWNPTVLPTLISILNVNTLIDVRLPDGSLIEFAGWVMDAKPNEHKEGEEPLLTITICASNVNPNNDTELAPLFA